LRSSPISDVRFRRAITDPWGLGLAVAAALAVAAVGRGGLIAAGAGLAVVAARVASEYLVPRGLKLELQDSFSAQDQIVRSSLDSTLAGIRGRVPRDVEVGVASIRQNVLDILSREARLAAHSPELFVVLRTATDYLPTALQAYLRLPAGYATSRQQADGKTALEILLEQLRLLDKEMVDVADAVTKQDLDRLRAHGRFLADRFAHSELELTAGPP
jgi:hypothetical protein